MISHYLSRPYSDEAYSPAILPLLGTTCSLILVVYRNLVSGRVQEHTRFTLRVLDACLSSRRPSSRSATSPRQGDVLPHGRAEAERGRRFADPRRILRVAPAAIDDIGPAAALVNTLRAFFCYPGSSRWDR